MKAKMIDTTNRKFKYLIGVEGNLEIYRQVWLYVDGLSPFRTSDVIKIDYVYNDTFNLEVHTLNSTYVFEVLR